MSDKLNIRPTKEEVLEEGWFDYFVYESMAQFQITEEQAIAWAEQIQHLKLSGILSMNDGPSIVARTLITECEDFEWIKDISMRQCDAIDAVLKKNGSGSWIKDDVIAEGKKIMALREATPIPNT